MSQSFETDGGEIVVTHEDGRVRRSPVAEGFDRDVFRNALAAVDVLYRREGVMPTVEEVYESWPKISLKTYSKLWTTSEFRQALALRGIDMSPNSGLTAEQSTALLVLANPDGRALTTKLKQLGISQPKYHAWMRQPLFAETLRQRSEQNLGDAIPTALNQLVANADRGDQRAVEKLLEISGRYNPSQVEAVNAKQVVLVMVEAVLRHVSSKEEKAAILSEVEGAMAKANLLNAASTKEIE